MNNSTLKRKKNEYGPNCIGNVIRILDTRTLIVNAGSEKLSVGDNIIVYVPVEPIYNLDGSQLAVYEYTKDELQVIETSLNYSVCQKNKKRTIDPAPITRLALSPLFNTVEEFVPLEIDENEISPLPIVDIKIHIGDPIKKA